MKNPQYKPDPLKRDEQLKFYAEWRTDHEDDLAELNRDCARASQGKNAAYAAKHRAKRLSAVPTWADLTAIEQLYAEATALGMHVDHIYPLQGKTVCGLHVANNLSLLDPMENFKKGNRIGPQTET